jgi:hypothetical protein
MFCQVFPVSNGFCLEPDGSRWVARPAYQAASIICVEISVRVWDSKDGVGGPSRHNVIVSPLQRGDFMSP